MVDFIIIVVIVTIVGLAGRYVYKSKKSGVKCIGCPDGATCGGNCAGCSGGACGDTETK